MKYNSAVKIVNLEKTANYSLRKFHEIKEGMWNLDFCGLGLKELW